MISKSRKGRPTKYNSEKKTRARAYIKKCLKDDNFLTIEELSRKLGVGTRTLYNWEAEYDDFLQTMNTLRDAQREMLINKALEGSYNTRFAMFLLKANHGMREKEPLVDNSQNNFSNISPELLADALTLMRSRDGRD